MSNDPLQPSPAPQPVPAVGPPTSGLAIAALICGVVGLMICGCGIVSSIPAIICGHMGLNAIKKSEGGLGGRGLALAGTILGYVGTALSLIFILVYGAVVAAAVLQELGKEKLNGNDAQDWEYHDKTQSRLTPPSGGLHLDTRKTPWRV